MFGKSRNGYDHLSFNFILTNFDFNNYVNANPVGGGVDNTSVIYLGDIVKITMTFNLFYFFFGGTQISRSNDYIITIPAGVVMSNVLVEGWLR